MGPVDSKKRKMDEGPKPSNEGRLKEMGAEGEAARLVLTRPIVDESLNTSLENFLRQALEQEKKLKEDVKRATK